MCSWLDGSNDGLLVGFTVVLGLNVGLIDGLFDGFNVGVFDGFDVGLMLENVNDILLLILLDYMFDYQMGIM